MNDGIRVQVGQGMKCHVKADVEQDVVREWSGGLLQELGKIVIHQLHQDRDN